MMISFREENGFIMRLFSFQALGKGVLCLFVSLLIALPQTGRASDKISEALYTQGIEIVEKAISDFKAKEAEYRKLYDEEMAKIEALKGEINRLQQERAQASEELSSTNDDIDRLRRRLRKLKELPTSYTVIKGDCLWYISGYKKIYNNPYKWVSIYSANRDKIKDPDLIYPGQVFRIPRGTIGDEPRPTQYEVMPGDFLYKIAGLKKIYNDPTKWAVIYQANRDQINDPDLIYPYQILDIPR